MSEQATTGPRRMRQWADYIEKNIKHHLLPLAVKNPDVLRELAAQWEANIAALEQSNRFLEQETFTRQKYGNQLHATEAALERARALLKRIEWQDATTRPIYCDIVVCVACGRDHPNHKPGCDLAALMAAAPGGAA